MPDYLLALDEHALSLADGINDFPNHAVAIGGEIRELDATLEAVERVLGRGNRKSVQDVRAAIRNTGRVETKAQARDLLERVRQLQRQLRYQASEEEWT